MMKTPKNTANAARTKARKVSDCSTSPCTFICTCKVAHAPGPNIHFLWLKLKLLHHDCNKTLPERLKIPVPWLGSEFGSFGFLLKCMYYQMQEVLLLTQFSQCPEGDKIATPGHRKQQQCQLQTRAHVSTCQYKSRDARRLCIAGIYARYYQIVQCFLLLFA